jgi:hypothetical protein
VKGGDIVELRTVGLVHSMIPSRIRGDDPGEGAMPIHDWTPVPAGEFHAFHNAWIAMLQGAMNDGRLPESYYALGEQRSGNVVPDILTLRTADAEDRDLEREDEATGGGVAVAEAPPRVSVVSEADADTAYYLARRRSLVIRHASGDRVVAIVEILSPGNKHSRMSINQFFDKAMAAFEHGIHMLFVDLFPPTSFDPNGLHGLVWDHVTGERYEMPAERPLTLAAYRAGSTPTAYVEPVGVGDELIDMPLFLSQERYVNVPLQPTYDQACRSMPSHTKRLLAAASTDD